MTSRLGTEKPLTFFYSVPHGTGYGGGAHPSAVAFGTFSEMSCEFDTTFLTINDAIRFTYCLIVSILFLNVLRRHRFCVLILSDVLPSIKYCHCAYNTAMCFK